MILKVLLAVLVSATAVWSVANAFVKCGRTNTTDDIKNFELANFTELRIRFIKKYLGEGKSYVKWQKLHEMKPINFNDVCDKYALMLSKCEKTKVVAEGKASFRDRYYLHGYRGKETFEIDTLTCLIKFLDKKGKVSSRMKYYLTEGDEPESAFRFALLQTTVVLTRFLTNIWKKEPKDDDWTVQLKIRIYNTTRKASATTKSTKGSTKAGTKTTAAGGNVTVTTVATTPKPKKKSGKGKKA